MWVFFKLLIFVVEKLACFKFCLLGVGCIQLTKGGHRLKKKVTNNTSFAVDKDIKFKHISI